MFDKLMFWKKKDDLALPPVDKIMGNNSSPGLPEDPNFGTSSAHGFESNNMLPDLNSGNDPMQQSSFGSSPISQFTSHDVAAPPSFQEHAPQLQDSRNDLLQKDMEIISAKLDYLKATLEHINQRLANIEREKEAKDYRW